jgi:hypothetical protein
MKKYTNYSIPIFSLFFFLSAIFIDFLPLFSQNPHSRYALNLKMKFLDKRLKTKNALYGVFYVWFIFNRCLILNLIKKRYSKENYTNLHFLLMLSRWTNPSFSNVRNNPITQYC